jgi:hypothetical protein
MLQCTEPSSKLFPAKMYQIQQQHITIAQVSNAAIERLTADQAARNSPPRLAYTPNG